MGRNDKCPCGSGKKNINIVMDQSCDFFAIVNGSNNILTLIMIFFYEKN